MESDEPVGLTGFIRQRRWIQRPKHDGNLYFVYLEATPRGPTEIGLQITQIRNLNGGLLFRGFKMGEAKGPERLNGYPESFSPHFSKERAQRGDILGGCRQRVTERVHPVDQSFATHDHT